MAIEAANNYPPENPEAVLAAVQAHLGEIEELTLAQSQGFGNH